MARSKSSRNFSAVTYLTTDQLYDLFRMRSHQIKHYAFIKHDQDVDADGNPKTEHVHFVVELLYACALDSVISWFSKFMEKKEDGTELPITTLVQIATDKRACYRYLIHFDDPDKYQYQVNNVFSDSLSYYKSYLTDAYEDRTYRLLMDIIDRKPYLYMVKNYGRDYVLNYEKYDNMADLIVRQLAYKADNKK